VAACRAADGADFLRVNSIPGCIRSQPADRGFRVMDGCREVEVPARQFRIFDFNRDNLPLADEPNTGRLQLRAVIQVVSMDGSERPVKLSVSREVMNNRDGVSRDVWTSGLGSIDVH
jgi:hypothetical protein